MSDKLRFTLSPQFLFFYTIIVLLVPNVTLSITEGMPLAAAVANVLLPACLYTLLMSLSGKTGRQVWILFPLVFFAAFQMVLIYLYGSGVIGVGMFLNLVTTNPDEALELLDNLVPALVIVFVLYLPLLFIACMQWARHTRLEATRRRSWRRAALLGLAASAVYTAALYVAYPKGEEKKGRFEYRVEDDMYPFNVFYNLGLAVRESYNSAHYQERVAHFKFGAVATHPADSAEVYLLVVGETARSRNFQLYGYKRPTNPLLSREQGLIVYTGVRTQSNTTHRSVPMLLTAATADDHDRLYHEKGILAAFGEAGFHTAFFSNQLPNHSYIDFLGEEAHDVRFIKKGK
ncbi:MAG: phosphoethanolamine transferase domain-containing protein, partial [Bacteroidales bacterium]|nr:phosphoethanolamine transferase domain-containing protein [Bacteroidales bacterium]